METAKKAVDQMTKDAVAEQRKKTEEANSRIKLMAEEAQRKAKEAIETQ